MTGISATGVSGPCITHVPPRPAFGPKTPRSATPRCQKSVISPLPVVLTEEEVEAVVEVAARYRQASKPDARHQTLVSLLLATGIKKGESLADIGEMFKCIAMERISIFMSVFNVHVNRAPYDGRVKEISYYPGKFFSANLDKASLENEHNAVFLETDDARPMCVVQVAGLIARRIICKIQPGDHLLRGQRFGLICFGSRLDVYLPTDIKLKVAPGDKVKAGTSILGHFI